MKTLLFLLLFSLPALAQSQASIKAKSDAPALPATVEITTKADVELIKAAQKDLKLAQLEARNFQLEIEAQLERLRKQAADLEAKAANERGKWQTMLSAMTQIPTDKLQDYEFREEGEGPNKKIILTQKKTQ